MIGVSDVVAAKAREVGAHAWLTSLDSLVGEVADAWNLHIGVELPGGTEAYVCGVHQADGTPAVLKMMIPRADDGLGARAAELEATVLHFAAGRGCAELYASDDERGALLMEKLGPSLFDLDLPLRQQHQIMVDCARALWQPASDVDLPTGAQKAEWLINAITTQWERLDQPCSEAAIDQAVTCGEQRSLAHDDEQSVLVHGDMHQWNTLATLDGKSYKLIDPDGLLAEPAYDLGILMREDPVELMANDPFDRAEELAAMTGLDPAPIWEWGVIERVSTGLLCVSIGLEPVGTQMLEAADRIATM